MAFFVGRNPDGVDGFVTNILKAGFGTGQADVTMAVLAKLWQVRMPSGNSVVGMEE